MILMSESVFKENIFDGKKVFITGGATGMGLGFAQAFLNHGAEVFIASRKEEKLAEAAAETEEKFGKKLNLVFFILLKLLNHYTQCLNIYLYIFDQTKILRQCRGCSVTNNR